jgi:DNA invertase Pin-like site-specific DNA recombinase
MQIHALLSAREKLMARPRKNVDAAEVLRLRLEGLSWPKIATRTSLGLGTVYRAYREAHAAIAPFQNPKGRHSKEQLAGSLPLLNS